ncbi:2Fe-2S iron-sulfur cluster-binding protein [Caenimonas aquaedulcis]|uniref:(2Fe-2S)-binding protein n=1 Tax=Caenimonas aquaedulcis TaxID=2793270 RepID=A0A931H2B0_9BURK|nr:2Fe-2S iron-sulfur cluster-binding protein [Caenimonas aquaedulcis]MBG9387218.1 (2Fe-2S)-binding protein [Caenimonas aquaedulcis]
MITVYFATADQPAKPQPVQCATERSLMKAALAGGIDGIAADCGGMMTCGTCHVFVREPFASRLPAPGEDENAMLGYTAEPRRANSRLACQIALDDSLDGLTVDLPRTQY